jgi:hypothetical protein
MRFLISLYGLSETGKTFSALKLACGMEPDPAKRMLLDTEGGQRGRAYVDAIPGGYMYASLSAPFTPERYIEALNEIEEAGINVLVIDSVSHAWFAEGGVLDMVENSTNKNDFAKWKDPKRRLGKMTRRLLSSDMHIILCSRAKQTTVEEIVDGRKKMVPGPVVPVQEKNLRYDMTIMARMLGDGRFNITAPEGKCPGSLRPVFEAGEKMDESMGRKLIDWLGGADVKSPAQRKLEAEANEAAEAGIDAYAAFFQALTKEQRAMILAGHEDRKSRARAADAERDRIAKEEAEQQDGRPAAPASASAPDLTEATEIAYGEALVAAQQGPAALKHWWEGEPGKTLAVGTDRTQKSLIAAKWRELERIAHEAVEREDA